MNDYQLDLLERRSDRSGRRKAPTRSALSPLRSINGGSGKQLQNVFKQGDAYDLLATLEPESIDLIITSPPYWGQRTYRQTHNWQIHEEWKKAGHSHLEPPAYDWYRLHGGVLGLEPYPEWYTFHVCEIIDRARKCLRDSGSIWLNMGDTYFARWSSIRENGRQGLGGHPRDRRRTPMGGTCRKNSCCSFRHALLFACKRRAGFCEMMSFGSSQTYHHGPSAIVSVSRTSTFSTS